MASKDKTLFKVSKHNDFSALCSDDEEMTTKPQEVVHVEASSAVAAHDSNEEAEGFETFTTVRKPKRVIHPKTSVPASSTGASTAGGAATRVIGKPKEVVTPKAENSIELYEFPSTLKTTDLRKFLNDFDGHYRLKWINDTSCYVVFDDESLGKRVLGVLILL